jgi:hypothetical protein
MPYLHRIKMSILWRGLAPLLLCTCQLAEIRYVLTSSKRYEGWRELLDTERRSDLFKAVSHCREPGSSVSVVSGYGLDDRAIEVRSPAEAKGFFL